MFLLRDPSEWAALGHALGLAAFAPTAGYGHGASFRQLKRALGVPAPPTPSFSHWLYGLRHGHEVLVLNYTVGAGSRRTSYTGALARVDPPLFLGLSLRASNFGDRLFGRTDIQVGHAHVDESLVIDGFDPARIQMLLSPHDPGGQAVLAAILRWTPVDLSVTDSAVVFSKRGLVTDAGQLGAYLDAAVHAARTLAWRRASLPASPGELSQRAAWQRFAEAEGFTFDPSRMTLTGDRGGARTKIALEVERQEIRTSVTVRFPRSIDVAFTARRTAMPSFLQGLFSPDITVGDPSFDDLFAVSGYPAPAVRAVLARPPLLALLKHLALTTSEIQIDHAQLYFRFVGPSATERELAGLVELGERTCAALFGEVARAQPYR